MDWNGNTNTNAALTPYAHRVKKPGEIRMGFPDRFRASGRGSEITMKKLGPFAREFPYKAPQLFHSETRFGAGWQPDRTFFSKETIEAGADSFSKFFATVVSPANSVNRPITAWKKQPPCAALSYGRRSDAVCNRFPRWKPGRPRTDVKLGDHVPPPVAKIAFDSIKSKVSPRWVPMAVRDTLR